MRRTLRLCLWGIVALASLLLALGLLVTNPTATRRCREQVTIDPDRLRAHVEALCAIEGGRSADNPAGLEHAADYIRSRWQELGLAVHEQQFEIEGRTFRNLLVRLGTSSRPLLVVGAHYDVAGAQPGADDNASGVAALLELARALSERKQPLRRPVELVAFTLEEPPYFRTPHMGSAVHAHALVEREEPVKAMISLEMIGYFTDAPGSQQFPHPLLGSIYPTRGDYVCVVADLGSWALTRAVKARMKGGGSVPVWSLNGPAAIPGIDFSDHQSYWDEGIQAVMVTDSAFYRNRNYHRPTDTADTLDYQRMAQVVRGVYAVATTL